MTTLQAEISRLDLAYQKLTGFIYNSRGVVNWREDAWARFVAAGFTVTDLEEVILWLKPKVKAGHRQRACLAFRRLIAQLDVFEDELAQARAEKRNVVPKPSEKEQVVRALPTLAQPPSESKVKRPKEYIERLIAEMRAQVK